MKIDEDDNIINIFLADDRSISGYNLMIRRYNDFGKNYDDGSLKDFDKNCGDGS